MRIVERQQRLTEATLLAGDARAVPLEPFAPVGQAADRNLETHFHRKTMAGARRRHLGPREKCQVAAGMPFRVGIEEMVGSGIVLVDAPLDETHSEHAGVEIQVLLRRPRDRRDVMQSVDAIHVVILALPPACSDTGTKLQSPECEYTQSIGP